jgi:hypothetical protein
MLGVYEYDVYICYRRAFYQKGDYPRIMCPSSKLSHLHSCSYHYGWTPRVKLRRVPQETVVAAFSAPVVVNPIEDGGVKGRIGTHS